MRLVFKSIFALTFMVACTTTNPEALSSQYATTSTIMLWSQHRITQSPLELAFIEAELGARGETNSGSTYLGRRTSAALGNQLYPRADRYADTKNCADFANAAAAQKFFLASGGPLQDQHDLDRDGDGLACEWGTTIRQIATIQAARTVSYSPRPTYRRCYVGPRGGTYTITASGNKNYGGC